MSDQPSAGSAASDTPTPTAGQPGGTGSPRKPRRWRRRIGWTLATLLVLAAALRLSLSFLLPPILRKAAGAYGLDARYDRLHLTLTGGEANIWGLTLTPKTGGDPVAVVDYVRGHISPAALLAGKLVVHRALADGVALTLDRDSDGNAPLIDLISAATAGGPDAPPPPTSEPMDLSAPLTLEALRLNRIHARIRDRSITPPVDMTVALDLRVSDLNDQGRPTLFEIDLWADPVLDVLRIAGEAQLSASKLIADFNMHARGLRLHPVSGYLQPMGLRPVADEIGGEGRGKLTIGTSAAAPDAIAVRLDLAGLRAVADDEEAASVNSIVLVGSEIGSDRATFEQLAIAGVRFFGRRTSEGFIRVAGVELAPTTQPAEPAGTQATPAAPPATQPATNYAWTLGEIKVQDVRAVVRDDSVTPSVELALLADKLAVNGLASGALGPTTGPATAPTTPPATIAGTLRVPGLAESITLSGTAAPFAETKAIDLRVDATGVSLNAIKPYLEPLGIESQIANGTFGCAMSADVTTSANGAIIANARLSDVSLKAPDELFALNDVNVSGLVFDPAGNRIAVGVVEISGPALSARRDESGALRAVGLILDPTKAQPTAPAPASSQPAPTAAVVEGALPAVEIGRFSWKDARVTIEDEMVQPPTATTISDAGVELSDVKLDLSGTAAAAPGKLRAWIAAPGIAETLTVSGTITPEPSAVAIDLDLSGGGITAAAAAPYLKPLGIDPLLKDGRVQGKIRGRVAASTAQDAVEASLAIENFSWADGDRELVGVDAFQLDDMRFAADETRAGAIRITKPRATVLREKDGAFIAGGARIRPVAPTVGQPQAISALETAPEPAPGTTPVFAVAKLALDGAAITWIDQAVSGEPVRITAVADASVDGFAFGPKAPASTVSLRLRITDVLENLTVAGTVTARPEMQSAKLDVNAAGVRAGPLATYLSPGTVVALKDGRFKAAIEATTQVHSAGGHSGRLAVAGLDYRDGEAAQPLASLDSARFSASRIDPASGIFAVEEVALEGFESDAVLTADGTTRLLGLMMMSAPPATEGTAAAPAPPAATPPAPASAPAQDVNALVAAAKKPPPLITLETLDLNVRRFGLRDESRPDAAPLELAEVRLRNSERVEIGGPEADARPPVMLQLTGAANPVIGSFTIAAQSAPLAQQPSLQVAVAADRISGAGLVALLPELKEQLDAAPLTAGQFRAELQSQATVSRRGGTIALADGFKLDASLTSVAFRAAPDGPVLLGLDEIRAEGAEIEPKTGGVRVKSLEVTKPIATAHRDADGLHVLGMVVKMPADETRATQTVGTTEGPPDPREATLSATTPSPTTPAPPATRPAAEMRIDRFLVSGIDVRFEDRSVQPPLVVPLSGLDVEVRDLSNFAPFEDRPIRFSMTLTADKVTLPKRLEANVIAGAVGDLGAVLKGKQVESVPEFEQRELFSQVSASGKLSLHPRPTGWVKTAVNGFELTSLSGPAQQQGITIGGGVFDSAIDARFHPDGTIDTRSKFSLTDLKVSEPPDGPIFRYLHLPAPLDAVILALQDASGSITVPLSVAIKDGEYSGGQVAASASTAFLGIVATALASAPLKVAGGVGNLVGVANVPGLGSIPGMGGGKTPDRKPVALAFAPGDAELSRETRRTVAALVERMKKDKKLSLMLRHELGGGDVSLAAARANPPAVDAADLASRLRARKIDLAQRRAQLAGVARGALASRTPAEVEPTLGQLRAVTRELAETEDALDDVYELFRPGADRQAPRRTRAASLDLAQSRLNAIRDLLMASGIPDARNRIRASNAQYNPAADATGGNVVVTPVGASK